MTAVLPLTVTVDGIRSHNSKMQHSRLFALVFSGCSLRPYTAKNITVKMKIVQHKTRTAAYFHCSHSQLSTLERSFQRGTAGHKHRLKCEHGHTGVPRLTRKHPKPSVIARKASQAYQGQSNERKNLGLGLTVPYQTVTDSLISNWGRVLPHSSSLAPRKA